MDDQYNAVPASSRRRLLIVNAIAIALIGGLMAVAGWSSTSSLGAAFASGIIPLAALVILALRAALPGRPAESAPAEAAVRTRPARDLAEDGLDAPSRALLRRTRSAITAVTSSGICRAGLLDRAAVAAALAAQHADITATLRQQTRIRALRAQRTPASAGPRTAAVLAGQLQAAQQAQASIAARVQALERYAAEVAAADAAYRDCQQAARAAVLHDQHLDLLARTAADQHAITDLETMSGQARAITRTLREPPP
jgi:hypothetical protein